MSDTHDDLAERARRAAQGWPVDDPRFAALEELAREAREIRADVLARRESSMPTCPGCGMGTCRCTDEEVRERCRRALAPWLVMADPWGVLPSGCRVEFVGPACDDALDRWEGEGGRC